MLRDRLAGIKGKFIMSINDVPEIREMFRDFTIQEVPTKYSMDKEGVKPVTELLIINYQPPKGPAPKTQPTASLGLARVASGDL